MTDNRQYAALEWVLDEIKNTLAQASEALESYSQNDNDTTQLRFCLTYIHQVYGSLHMLEFHSAAMLAEEIESLAHAFLEQRIANREEAQEVLMRAILQLPNYLQQVRETRQDNPSAALSLINDLRAVRGVSLLQNASFFNPDLNQAYRIGERRPSITQDDKKFKSVIEKSRQMYRQATANIIGRSNSDENLEYLSKVCEHLQKITHNTYQFAVWQITAALVEGLQQKAITLTSAVKNAFNQLEQELERLSQHGIAILDKRVDEGLLKNLLYCMASAQSSSKLINDIKESYALNVASQEKINLIDNTALRSVRAAIEAELNDIKNTLDRCLENENPKPHLADIENVLVQINDTLVVLGIGSLRKKIQSQLSALQVLQAQESPITNEQLLTIANSIVEIEDSLDNALSSNQGRGGAATSSANYQFDKAQVSVMRESRNGLEKAKDGITEYIATQWDVESIKLTPVLLRETRGGLLMLTLDRPAQILDACADYIEQQLINAGVLPEWDQLDNLADAIASVDYYLERMLSDFSDDNEFLLNVAEKSMASLGYPVAVLPQPEKDAEISSVMSAGESVIQDDIEAEAVSEQFSTAEQDAKTEHIATVADDDLLDDEIIEIFVEEAAEVKETIVDFLPQWAANFNDVDALKELRRAFHTLKGSGRMVNANEIGELAWSIENILNRVIDNTIPATKVIIDLIQKVCDIQEDMIDAFKRHRPAPQQQLIEQYMAWGHQIASGDSPDISFNEIDLPESATVSADQQKKAVADPQLLEIFINESNGHLKTIKDYIAEVEDAMPIYHPPSDLMQRALHTLKGSAFMIEILPIADLMTVMENFVKELRSYQVDINADILQLTKDSVSHIEVALSQLAKNTMPEIPQLQHFIGRVAQLREVTVGALIHQQDQQNELKKADPRLLENFMIAEMGLLLEMDPIIDNWRIKGAQISEFQAVADELGKLGLGAKEANLPPMTRLSDELQRCYQKLISGAIDSSDHCYSVLQAGHTILLNTVDAVAAGQNIPEIEEDVFIRFQSLYTDIDSNKELKTSIAFDSDVELDSVTKEEAESSQHIEATDDTASNHTASKGDASELINEVAATPPSSAGLGVSNNEEVDDEIVEIFLEEANELLEEIDEIIHGWEEDPSDISNNSALQRSLHTVKGGARLANFVSLGDLAHNFETFLTDNKNNALTNDFFANVQKFQDKLHHAINPVTSRLGDAGQPTTDTVNSLEKNGTADSIPVSDEPEPIKPVADPPVSDSKVTQLTDSNQLPLVPKNNTVSPILPHLKAVPAAPHITAVKKSSAVQEVLKVPADLMEELVNLAGETSISRGRMEEQVSEIGLSLDDMDMTVQRLQEQIRRLDIETEAQVLFRQEQIAVESSEFDPLEMDRYTQLQQLTRSLIESASDLMDFKSTLVNKVRDTETILLQQSRINTDLQEGLMRSRMVPFASKVPRLRRIVRQISSELNKSVNFDFDNAEGELDRSILEKMVVPLDHMLRNAIDHGIEDAETRIKLGKPAEGHITLSLHREGGDIVLRLTDDGCGINIEKVRQKAIERNLMNADAQLSDQDILQFILHAGFSTAETITQISGRGVGMDVVNNEIKQIGGNLSIESTFNKGTAFIIRLPFTVSVNRALMVMIGEDLYAIPLNTIEGIALIKTEKLKNYYSNADTRFEYAGKNYQVRYLASMMTMQAKPKLEDKNLSAPILLVHSGDHRIALQVDELQSSREIVVKSLGTQFSSVRGLSGVTIMGDGSVVIILDLHALIRRDAMLGQQSSALLETEVEKAPTDKHLLVMVVDDSVTVRKVTTRLLERAGFDVVTAKDGVEAMNMLQDCYPDVMLLDIEMPRMDGFEVAKNVRSSSRLKNLPIIMITSRTGEKHRQRGLDLGVNIYMGKPYQEEKLLDNIGKVIGASSSIKH